MSVSDAFHPVSRTLPVGRYAPSPTGELHLGNLRTALLAWQDARRRGGLFLMRIEDLDTPRTVAGSEVSLLDDLRWLGIEWDEGPDLPQGGGPAGPYRQSERLPLYQAALDRLVDAGLAYGCTCSRKDLREASAPHGPEGVIYPGLCRERGIDPRTTPDCAIRFRVDRAPLVRFEDLEFGCQESDLEAMSGDFVIRRRDGLFAYQLACAVDDALMGITHVVRGADLLWSTPRQIALLRALELPAPAYHHVPLVLDKEGRRMSKRNASPAIRLLRAAGQSADEVREIILNAPVGMPGITST